MSSQITVYTLTRIFIRNFRANMVAAINWCSHTTLGWIWLVIYFGFNDPLRQYFSLYRAVSQRGRKKRKKIDERKCSNNPHPHLLQAQYSLALLFSKLVGHPGTGSLPSTIAPPRDWTSISLCENNKLHVFGFT